MQKEENEVKMIFRRLVNEDRFEQEKCTLSTNIGVNQTATKLK